MSENTPEIVETALDVAEGISIALSRDAIKQLFIVNVAAAATVAVVATGTKIFIGHKIRQISAKKAQSESND